MHEEERRDDLAERPEEAFAAHHEETTKVVSVDDLADEQDYWLSLTDAARVTRRQEVTIRRWVLAGTLPVRRTHMGVNKRTRHVRASDLRKLTPIIDPTAAITGVPANADLLSIPVQQASILASQHDLLQQILQLGQRLVTMQHQVEEQHAQHVAVMDRLRDDFAQSVQQIQAQSTTTLTVVTQQLHQQHERQEQQWAQTTSTLAEEKAARIGADQQHHQELQHTHAAFVELSDAVAYQAAQIQALRTDLAAQISRLDQRTDQYEQQIAQLRVELTQGIQSLHEVTNTVAQDHHADEERYEALRQDLVHMQAEVQQQYQEMGQRIAAASRRFQQRLRRPKRT